MSPVSASIYLGTFGADRKEFKALEFSRWEHEAVLETAQTRLDDHPEKMTMRRSTAEHPFGTIKCWMGATRFLTKRLPKVITEMKLNVLASNISG